MPKAGFTIQVDDVDPGMGQCFQDIMQAQQTAFAQIVSENNRLRARVEQLERENEALRRATGPTVQPPQSNGVGPRGAGRGTATGRAAPVSAQNLGSIGNLGPAIPKNDASLTGSPFMLERHIKIHNAPVHGVAMSLDSKLLATASWDSTTKIYDLQANEVVKVLGDPSGDEEMGGLYAVAFCKTRPELLACTSVDKAVYLWNHKTGTLERKMEGHQSEVNGVDFHHSQTVMATASDDGRVQIWDFSEGVKLRTLDGHDKEVYGCKFLGQDYQYLVATCSFDQKARVFDMRNKNCVATLCHHTDDIIGIDFSPRGNLLATGSDDGLVALWDARTWRMAQQINACEDPHVHDNEVKRVAFSMDGRYLAAACSSQRVQVYDVTQPKATVVDRLEGHTDCVFDVAWGVCPQTGARSLTSASHDQSCIYWREVR